MRPSLLTMKAFGSYADETSVNFEQFVGGLYLIVGKTGSGKTTIFDAISFALFGQPSGSDRKTEMLHSDFVPLSQDTEVTLEFSHRGRKYRVERKLHFPKARKGDGYGNMNQSAVMTGDGMDPLEGSTKVTARCEELLGINSAQFRSIVMLAQGEFREFLRSGSDQKNDILGRLFDSSEYVRYQNLLAAVRNSLKEKRSQQAALIKSVMEGQFVMPQDADAQEREGYIAGHPALADNLKGLVEKDEAAYAAVKEELEKAKLRADELTRREVEANNENSLLQELEARKKDKTELEGRREALEARHEIYSAAQRAYRRVKPAADAAVRAAEALEKARGDMARLEETRSEQLAAYEGALAASEADGPVRQELAALAEQDVKLADAMPQYDALAEKTALAEKAALGRDAASRSAADLAEKKAAVDSVLEGIRAELLTLEGAGARRELAESELQAAKERLAAVTAPGEGVAALVADVRSGQEALAEITREYSALCLEASAADEKYHSLYQAFLEGQAGLIAREMEEELAGTGQTVCRVCGARYTSGGAHSFALPQGSVPEKRDVDKAESASRAAEKKRSDKQSDREKLEALLEHQKKAAVSGAAKLDADITGWDVLSAPDRLESLTRRLSEEADALERALKAAGEKVTRREQLLKEEKENTEASAELEKRAADKEKESKDLELEQRSLSGAAEQIKQLLPYPDRAGAEAALEDIRAASARLQDVLDAHRKELDAAKESLDRTSGALNKLKSDLPGLEKAGEEARLAAEAAMAENGFTGANALRDALSPMGSEDPETWLRAEETVWNDYQNDLRTTGEKVEELTRKTEGFKPTDLAALGEELEAARQARLDCEDKAAAFRSVLEGHRNVCEKVTEASTALAGTEAAFSRINRLADLAVGVTGEGGKLSFERYVMGAFFREVLYMANRRLDIMTGGRFELIHTTEAGRSNAVAGLDVDVLDKVSGRQRPSGSISGGEGFMVSLALALGLSDVVQNRAGGKKLDTLFIDEGFGTLDGGKLDNVITVLKQLTEGNRLVGVISHVDKLEESIPMKVRVKSTSSGSTLETELS